MSTISEGGVGEASVALYSVSEEGTFTSMTTGQMRRMIWARGKGKGRPSTLGL